MGASPSRFNEPSADINESTARSAQPSATTESTNGVGAAVAVTLADRGQPLSDGVEEVFRNHIATLITLGLSPTVDLELEAIELDTAPYSDANDSLSCADSVASGASAPAQKTPIWLDFTATPIRDDITPDAIKRIISLRHTNHFFYQQSEPYLDMLTEQLVTLVLNGMEDEANALIQACAFLLARRTTVTDPVGRVYKNVTAYEAALYAGDTQMCEMMHPLFEWLGEDGEAMRSEQCHKVFPDGLEAVIDAQQAYDFNSLIDVLSKASDDDVRAQLKHKVTYTELGEAINQFREDFVALSKQEQHANLKHLLMACELYAKDERFADLDRLYDPKMQVFCSQVIGFVQLYLPECDKQAFDQGLYDVVQHKRRLTRRHDNNDSGLHLRPWRAYPACGFDYAAGPIMLGGSVAVVGIANPVYLSRTVGKLRSNKSIKLGKLLQTQTSLAMSCAIQ